MHSSATFILMYDNYTINFSHFTVNTLHKSYVLCIYPLVPSMVHQQNMENLLTASYVHIKKHLRIFHYCSMEWEELEHFNGCYSASYLTTISEPVGEAIFNLWNGNLFQLVIAYHIWKYLHYVQNGHTNTHRPNLFTPNFPLF